MRLESDGHYAWSAHSDAPEFSYGVKQTTVRQTTKSLRVERVNDVLYLNGQGYSSEPALDTYRLLGVAPEGIQLEVSVPVVEAGSVAEIEVRFTNLQTSPVDSGPGSR